MEAFFIASAFRKKARLRFTGRAFHGRLYEWASRWRYRLRGYRIVARNVRTKLGEIDFIVEKNGLVTLVEVRGRANGRYPMYGPRKIARLKRLALTLRRPVRIELVEIVGPAARPWAQRVRVLRV